MWTIHCMKLNSPKHRFNTKSHSLSCSSSFNTKNCECWSCTTTSSLNSVVSLYLAFAEKEVEDWIRPEMRAHWQRLRSNDCVDSFTADVLANLFPRTSCVKHKELMKESLVFLMKSSDVRRSYVYVLRRTAPMTSPLINLILAVNVSKKAYWNRAATDHWKSIWESWTKR